MDGGQPPIVGGGAWWGKPGCTRGVLWRDGVRGGRGRGVAASRSPILAWLRQHRAPAFGFIATGRARADASPVLGAMPKPQALPSLVFTSARVLPRRLPGGLDTKRV